MSDIASIDRRVRATGSTDTSSAPVHRVSDLRGWPFVVVLGEPGIGKSTVFASEAASAGAPVIKVRDLMTDDDIARGECIFLDGLDEYRAEGSPADKIHGLAQSIRAAKASRWWLACRSEDWRKKADIAAIQRTTAGSPILVVQLLPLDDDEAVAMLAAMGELDPQAFVARAHAFGATAFVENPLSLKLLHGAVAGGAAWPDTRYALFDAAIYRLAHDQNPEYRFARHSSAEAIVAAAGRCCFALLATGARSIWRSAAEPPVEKGGVRSYLTALSLGIDAVLMAEVLDTALFRGEGEAFEPLHRTVAEYLAGRTLAQAVVGVANGAALPLTRAIGLIAGADGKVPSELRGLYGWFAAHLAKLGDEAGARRIIEGDAFTVLAYGDAAVFGTAMRRVLLQELGREDPYFRASEVGVTAIGGLAGEDLSSEFAEILDAPPDDSHRLYTVFEALTKGSPVHSLRPRLHGIAMDPARPEWQRWRAADAWLNGSADPVVDRRLLFDALSPEPISSAREMLRIKLLAALPRTAMTAADVRSVICDYQDCPEDNTIARLYPMQCRLEVEPMPELFEQPVTAWLAPKEQRKHELDIDSLLHHALASVIAAHNDLTAKRLLGWISNVFGDFWSGTGDEIGEAVRAWIDESPAREIELFDAFVEGDNRDNGPWVVINEHAAVARRPPSVAVVQHLLDRAVAQQAPAESRRLLAIAVEAVLRKDADIHAYWAVHDVVSRLDDGVALLSRLSATVIPEWRQKDASIHDVKLDEHAKQRLENIADLTAKIAWISSGKEPTVLGKAAQQYFVAPNTRNPEVCVGMQKVITLTDESIAKAISEGWVYTATVNLGMTSSELGEADARGETFAVELSALAGLDMLLAAGRPEVLSNAPLPVALAALKAGWHVRDKTQRDSIQQWALGRLERDPSAGAAELLAFWIAGIGEGASRLALRSWTAGKDQVFEFVRLAIDGLLVRHPEMHEEVLKAAISIAARSFERSRLTALAERALADKNVLGAHRRLWKLLLFALHPAEFGDRFFAEYVDEDLPEMFDEISDGFAHSLEEMAGTDRILFRQMTVRLLGRLSVPDVDRGSGEWTRDVARAHRVHGAINWLSRQSAPAASVAIAHLIQDESLGPWRAELRHASANQARLRRDAEFAYPSLSALLAALNGGPPVNARDLQAVVTEELRRLAAEMHTGDNTPWKLFWNLDANGAPTGPLAENDCRNRLLDRLRDRLKPYGIAAALPEIRRGENTRADILVLSAVGKQLPVEAKRHFHPEIWRAASTQLQGYAADARSEGFGVYLVFWFGNGATPTPSRPDGCDGPKAAVELEAMLRDDLSPHFRERTEVVVFDVSDPRTASTRKPRKKRAGST